MSKRSFDNITPDIEEPVTREVQWWSDVLVEDVRALVRRELDPLSALFLGLTCLSELGPWNAQRAQHGDLMGLLGTYGTVEQARCVLKDFTLLHGHPDKRRALAYAAAYHGNLSLLEELSTQKPLPHPDKVFQKAIVGGTVRSVLWFLTHRWGKVRKVSERELQEAALANQLPVFRLLSYHIAEKIGNKVDPIRIIRAFAQHGNTEAMHYCLVDLDWQSVPLVMSYLTHLVARLTDKLDVASWFSAFVQQWQRANGYKVGARMNPAYHATTLQWLREHGCI